MSASAHRRRPRLAALLALLLVAWALPAAAQEAAPDGIPLWRRSLYKMLTFEAAANTADVALYALILGGGPASAAGFFAVNVATAGLAYYSHEIAWDSFGPAVDAENATDVAVRKTISYRVVSTARNLALGGLFGAGLATSIGFTLAGQAADAVLYFANETLWTRFGPPVAR